MKNSVSLRLNLEIESVQEVVLQEPRILHVPAYSLHHVQKTIKLESVKVGLNKTEGKE